MSSSNRKRCYSEGLQPNDAVRGHSFDCIALASPVMSQNTCLTFSHKYLSTKLLHATLFYLHGAIAPLKISAEFYHVIVSMTKGNMRCCIWSVTVTTCSKMFNRSFGILCTSDYINSVHDIFCYR